MKGKKEGFIKKSNEMLDRYNKIEEEVGLDRAFLMESSPLPSYSMDFSCSCP